MGTHSAPQLAVLFLYAYDAEFIQGFLKNKDRKLTKPLIPASSMHMMLCH